MTSQAAGLATGTDVPVRLPFLVCALDGPAELDRVPVGSVTPVAGGGLVVHGRGARFDAVARWSPVEAAVPRWDVSLEVTLGRGGRVRAGLAVAVQLDAVDDPGWLVPGLFYGENRPRRSRARYPRFAGEAEGDPWTSARWSFRSDRAAIPAVFARDTQRGLALATTELSALGLTGLGFAAGPASTELRLHFPYREEPLAYDGSPEPRPADRPAVDWSPGDRVRLDFRVYLLGPEPAGRTAVLRDLHGWLAATAPLAPRVSPREAGTLAAEGLLRWHWHPEHDALYETAAFDRAEGSAPQPGDRAAMHVGWLSGAPAAAALLAHGRRTGRADAVEASERVLDAIAGNLAPCGTFWAQWTAVHGWGKGWTPGEDRVHGRTLAEAALFMGRAADAAAAHGRGEVARRWAGAVASNLAFVAARQRPDGALPADWDARTGEPGSWDGTSALAWVPALVEGARRAADGRLLEAARKAGVRYAPSVRDGFLFGAPEDVDLGPTSEDGYLAVMAYLALAEAEDEPDSRAGWLDLARRAADWALTFRYAYNVAFDPATTLGRHDFRTRGADQASPANEHLHAYGLVCLPEMVRLARLTGDDHYLERTRENLACFRQFVARHDGDFDARRGMAPERYYQTACFGPKGEIGPISHAWCLGLLLWACEAALELPELAEGAA